MRGNPSNTAAMADGHHPLLQTYLVLLLHTGIPSQSPDLNKIVKLNSSNARGLHA